MRGAVGLPPDRICQLRLTLLTCQLGLTVCDTCGVGPIMAAIFVAEIGEVGRFPTARHLCSWAGLTPSHRESDTKVQRGHITKQGTSLVRWAAVEAVVRYHGGVPIAPAFMRIAKRRGQMN